MSFSEWRKLELKDICSYSKDKISIEQVSLDNYISTENMLVDKGGVTKSSGLPSAKTVSKYVPNNILISNIRPYFKKIWYGDKVGGASNDVLIFQNSPLIEPKFLYYFLSQDKFFEFMTGTSKGTKMPRGDKDAIMRYNISLPPLEEQKAIANILSSLDEKIELNNQMNKTLEEMAQALFKRWFVDFEFPNENGEPYKSSGGEMVDSELGMIPKGWKVKGVDELVDSISKKHSFNKEKVIFINTSDVLEGEVLHDIYSAVDGLPGQAKKSICKGDILYSEIRPKNKRFAYINFSAEDYVVSTKLMVLRAKGNIGSEMLYFYLTSDGTIDYLQMIAESRSGTFPQITFTELSRLKIAMPLEDVMEQMNSIFKSLLDKIQYNKKNNKWLTELRDTLLPKLMSGEIRVTDMQN